MRDMETFYFAPMMRAMRARDRMTIA